MTVVASVVVLIHTLFMSSLSRIGYLVCGIMVMFKKILPWHAICKLASKNMIMTKHKKKGRDQKSALCSPVLSEVLFC